MCGGSATASSPHPGQVVRAEVLRPLGLSLTKAAQILGVRRATLSDLANGRTAVSAEMALRLEKAFGVSMDLLLRMQAGYDAAQARRRAAEINVRRYRPNLVPATD
jgi:addiction module HigA family antidote